MKRIHRKIERTPEELAKLKADREQYQAEKLTPEQHLAAGGHTDFVSHAEVLEAHAIAVQIRKEREAQEVSLKEMERRTGIDQAALSRIETGANANPSIGTLARILAALGKILTIGDAPKKSDPGRHLAACG